MPKIYCDMDGVLVDLLGSIKKHLGTTKLNQGILDELFRRLGDESAQIRKSLRAWSLA